MEALIFLLQCLGSLAVSREDEKHIVKKILASSNKIDKIDKIDGKFNR